MASIINTERFNESFFCIQEKQGISMRKVQTFIYLKVKCNAHIQCGRTASGHILILYKPRGLRLCKDLIQEAWLNLINVRVTYDKAEMFMSCKTSN